MFDSIEIVRDETTPETTGRPHFTHHAKAHIGPDTLGSCDVCGEDQPMTGNLYRQPDASYACPDCDFLHHAMFGSCDKVQS